jgi:ABC-type multidrug transport system ATPase subunit
VSDWPNARRIGPAPCREASSSAWPSHARWSGRPLLLLADEPTGNLDEHTAAGLHELLREMHREHNLTSIIATHNASLAAACDRVLRLEGGRLRAEGLDPARAAGILAV